jgi:hypothetical protein
MSTAFKPVEVPGVQYPLISRGSNPSSLARETALALG